MQPKILIADDDESVRRMISRVLEIAGYDTLQAATWRETITRCAAPQPALILLDLELLPPGGWRALRELQRDPEPVPVIGMTGWPFHRQEAIPRGLGALVEKPLDLGLLLQKIQQSLKIGPAVPA